MAAEQLLSCVSPKIIADLVHFAEQDDRNRNISYYLINDIPKTKAILLQIIDLQSEERKKAIYDSLSEYANKFLEKEKSQKEKKKEKRAQRIKLRKTALHDSL